ncbi:unnamed protein product [Leptidea sinapis]|uniref:FLYWCH-type domain-containing protein n=1 Tax=Leptidea sinapis TaxID=189913 RepID=A0A5E4PZ53_9NEOP|nr:unnamed protein product [Leptidea sinapis]
MFSVNVIYNKKGYPKLVCDGYFYRPHNAYRNQPKVLWYCSGRSKFQCPATLRTYNRELTRWRLFTCLQELASRCCSMTGTRST